MGNKNDDPDRKVVLTADAQTFAQQMGIQLFETSAKENINVEEVSNTGRERERERELSHTNRERSVMLSETPDKNGQWYQHLLTLFAFFFFY